MWMRHTASSRWTLPSRLCRLPHPPPDPPAPPTSPDLIGSAQPSSWIKPKHLSSRNRVQGTTSSQLGPSKHHVDRVPAPCWPARSSRLSDHLNLIITIIMIIHASVLSAHRRGPRGRTTTLMTRARDPHTATTSTSGLRVAPFPSCPQYRFLLASKCLSQHLPLAACSTNPLLCLRQLRPLCMPPTQPRPLSEPALLCQHSPSASRSSLRPRL